MGETTLSMIQGGIESVHGTAVAATVKFLVGEVPPVPEDRSPTLIKDNAGVRSESVREQPRIDEFLVKDTLPFPDLYFQALPFWFSLGVKGNITPAEQTGSEGDYLWAFSPSMTATNAQDSATIEMGDDVQAYELDYLMVESYRIAGVVSQDGSPTPVTMAVNYFARQLSNASFTAAIAIPATKELIAKLCRFYEDTSWANIGNTEKTGLLRAFDIQILTGLHPKMQGGANKYFDIHGEGTFKVIANLVLEGNAAANAIQAKKQAGTKDFLQWSIDGPQIGAGDNHSWVLGTSGFWMSVIPMAQKVGGNNLHSAIFESAYDITGAQELALDVTTDVAAI